MTKAQCEKRHQRGQDSFSSRWAASRTTPWLLSAMFCSALLPGCVSVEKYDAERARALNFQRLLAQEESRAGEFNAQLQEAKIEIASLGSQKRELAVEIDSLKGQINLQRTNNPVGDSPAVTGSAAESDDMFFSETSLSELGLPDLAFDESAFQDLDGGSDEEVVYHTVGAGETLYRLSRNYGVTIGQLKAWNDLVGDTISIGQQLRVSTPR